MLEDLKKDRLAKLKKIKEAGIDPYPARTGRTLTNRRALEEFETIASSGKSVTLSGRVMSIRDQGKLVFLDLHDESGKFQAVLKKDNLGNFDFLKSVLDRGDFVSVEGTLFKTTKGEESVEVKNLAILAKSLNPIPTEWYGVEDIELRLRKRYLDLLLSPETKELFRKKAVFWESFREYLRREEFLEVELPVLETLPGGAEAEPFVTHHNALDADFYLRISLELPLKKLLVGGFEKVFEIGRIFRNEGIDREHLQDYTQLECYWAYHNYKDMMDFTERMYREVIEKTVGGLETSFEDKKINWEKDWPKVDFREAFKDANEIDPVSADRGELFSRAEFLGLTPDKVFGKGRLIDLIFKKTVRPTLVQPCFLVDPPVEVEPLAKRSERNLAVVERFQIMACGTELGKGFSELNDSIDQRARFEEQMRLRAAGDKEAQRLDEDFLEALEYGMPPAAGFGVSERLFSVLMDKPIRETVFFPLMRPKSRSNE